MTSSFSQKSEVDPSTNQVGSWDTKVRPGKTLQIISSTNETNKQTFFSSFASYNYVINFFGEIFLLSTSHYAFGDIVTQTCNVKFFYVVVYIS